MELSADPDRVAEMRLTLASRGGLRPDAFALGMLMGKARSLAEAHGGTCCGVGCATCDEIVDMLSMSAAFIVDNIPDLDESIDQILRGEAPIPEVTTVERLTETLTAAVKAKIWRDVEGTGLLFAVSGALLGWAVARSGHPVAVGSLAAAGIAVPALNRLRRLRQIRRG